MLRFHGLMAFAAVFVALLVGLPSTPRPLGRSAQRLGLQPLRPALNSLGALSSVTPLATNGAKVTSAREQPAAGTGAKAVGAFCCIMVKIANSARRIEDRHRGLLIDGKLTFDWIGNLLCKEVLMRYLPAMAKCST
jgi:hypothetical protein